MIAEHRRAFIHVNVEWKEGPPKGAGTSEIRVISRRSRCGHRSRLSPRSISRRLTVIVVAVVACLTLSRLLFPPSRLLLSSHPSPSKPLSRLNHHPALQLRERRVILIALRACTDGPSGVCGEMYSHADQCIPTMPLSVPGYTNPRICGSDTHAMLQAFSEDK
jgi:hypothetical protein